MSKQNQNEPKKLTVETTLEPKVVDELPGIDAPTQLTPIERICHALPDIAEGSSLASVRQLLQEVLPADPLEAQKLRNQLLRVKQTMEVLDSLAQELLNYTTRLK